MKIALENIDGWKAILKGKVEVDLSTAKGVSLVPSNVTGDAGVVDNTYTGIRFAVQESRNNYDSSSLEVKAMRAPGHGLEVRFDYTITPRSLLPGFKKKLNVSIDSRRVYCEKISDEMLEESGPDSCTDFGVPSCCGTHRPGYSSLILTSERSRSLVLDIVSPGARHPTRPGEDVDMDFSRQQIDCQYTPRIKIE